MSERDQRLGIGSILHVCLLVVWLMSSTTHCTLAQPQPGSQVPASVPTPTHTPTPTPRPTPVPLVTVEQVKEISPIDFIVWLGIGSLLLLPLLIVLPSSRKALIRASLLRIDTGYWKPQYTKHPLGKARTDTFTGNLQTDMPSATRREIQRYLECSEGTLVAILGDQYIGHVLSGPKEEKEERDGEGLSALVLGDRDTNWVLIVIAIVLLVIAGVAVLYLLVYRKIFGRPLSIPVTRPFRGLVARYWLWKRRLDLRKIICEEWNYLDKRDKLNVADVIQVCAVVADILNVAHFGWPVPALVVSAIIVRRGLDSLCGYRERKGAEKGKILREAVIPEDKRKETSPGEAGPTPYEASVLRYVLDQEHLSKKSTPRDISEDLGFDLDDVVGAALDALASRGLVRLEGRFRQSFASIRVTPTPAAGYVIREAEWVEGIAESFRIRGVMYRRIGRTQQAIDALRKYLALIPYAADRRQVEKWIGDLECRRH